MIQSLSIALGGAAGALARYWVSNAVYALMGRSFPFGTLVVNLSGSFVMGLLYSLMIERMVTAPEVRGVLLVGFLGAFTTFSTFSIETLNLIEQADYLKALLNILVSVFACIFAAWLGVWLARLI